MFNIMTFDKTLSIHKIFNLQAKNFYEAINLSYEVPIAGDDKTTNKMIYHFIYCIETSFWSIFSS